MLMSLEPGLFMQVANLALDSKVCFTTKEIGAAATVIGGAFMYMQKRADSMAERYIKRLESIEESSRKAG